MVIKIPSSPDFKFFTSLLSFSNEKTKLEIELGKVYMDSRQGDFAKNIFESIIEQEENKKIKREKSEAYFQLGYIALMNDFNLDIAKEYFESSNEKMSSSYYGRESKVYLNKITRYNTLIDFNSDYDSIFLLYEDNCHFKLIVYFDGDKIISYFTDNIPIELLRLYKLR